MINQLTDGDYGRHFRGRAYELFCDICGEIGVRQETFKECVDYAKKNKWKSKSIRTKDSYQRYLWCNYCPKCLDRKILEETNRQP